MFLVSTKWCNDNCCYIIHSQYTFFSDWLKSPVNLHNKLVLTKYENDVNTADYRLERATQPRGPGNEVVLAQFTGGTGKIGGKCHHFSKKK